jgi:hypothetical protein
MQTRGRRSGSGIAIELQVGGEVWRRVESLATSGPGDRHFVLSTDETGATTLRFGDGAHGARLPAGPDGVIAAYRPGQRFAAVLQQQGRVIVDSNWREPGTPAADRLYGLYRGVVTDNVDPLGQARVLAQVPVVGGASRWAMPCRPVAAATLPPIGAAVWVAFEAGDPAQPVWMGVR